MALRIALLAASYLLGSVSFGLIIASRRGVDLRRVGSGNIGATNVGRALGTKAFVQVMLLDALKGLVPTLVARWALPAGDPWVGGVAVAAVVGHAAPVWHGFRGGKSVATTAGVVLALEPLAAVAMAATYGSLRKLTKVSSVGSLAGTVVALGTTAAIHGSTATTWATLAVGAVVVVRHADNIARLWRGRERTVDAPAPPAGPDPGAQ